jgi:hypothetical protein
MKTKKTMKNPGGQLMDGNIDLMLLPEQPITEVFRIS